ncbi:hypothetical protein BJY52DRAFT_185571 [Lactarius psammicola]|nr:hypothetical protein BJY52DRAFT_185571 [Lactarius psammicola]
MHPGGSIDHLSGTSNFSLQHMRFLAIDEVDWLLARAQVLAATRPPVYAHRDQTQGGQDGVDSIPSPAFLYILPGGSIMCADIDKKGGPSELRNPCYVVVQSVGGVQMEGFIVARLHVEHLSFVFVINDRTISTKWACKNT